MTAPLDAWAELDEHRWLPRLDVDLTLARGADRTVAVLALVAGVLIDAVVRADGIGLAATVTLLVVAGGLLGSGRLANPQAKGLVATVVLFAPWLTLRTSAWLVVPDVLACLALIFLAASYASGGTVVDLTVPDVVIRTAGAIRHASKALAFVWEPFAATRPSWRRLAPVAKGAALAAPVLLIVGALLASADPLFASLFRLPTSTSSLVGHTVVILLGSWSATWLLRVTSARRPPTADPSPRARLGTTEATTVLALLVALYTAFAATQGAAIAGAGRHVLRTRGLTYAEYARSGFFQLLAVSAVTLLLLMAVRALATREHGLITPLLVLSEISVALTLVIVAVAIHRLALYEHAYGLTMLRLYSTIAAGWIAIVFVMLAISLVDQRSRRRWFVSAAGASLLIVVLVLNFFNPEVYVARVNLARSRVGHSVDPNYLWSLSDDAAPTVLATYPEDIATCSVHHAPKGIASFNLSARAAARVRARACR